MGKLRMFDVVISKWHEPKQVLHIRPCLEAPSFLTSHCMMPPFAYRQPGRLVARPGHQRLDPALQPCCHARLRQTGRSLTYPCPARLARIGWITSTSSEPQEYAMQVHSLLSWLNHRRSLSPPERNSTSPLWPSSAASWWVLVQQPSWNWYPFSFHRSVAPRSSAAAAGTSFSRGLRTHSLPSFAFFQYMI